MNNKNKQILLAGGYGVVGALAARILRDNHPGLELLIGGRNPEKGEALAKSLGNARCLKLDMNAPSPLNAIDGPPDAVFGFVHDGEDRMLADCIARGVPYGDITRGPADQFRGYISASMSAVFQAPVLFSANWMGGVPSVLAMHMTSQFQEIVSIDLSILYYGADKVGPDSGGAASAMSKEFAARIDGAWRDVKPMSDGRQVTFPSGLTRKVYRMNMADVTTLAAASGADNVAVRLGLDNGLALSFMRVMLKLGLWPLIAKLGGQPAQQTNGKGARHEFVIEVEGIRADGKRATKRLTVLDPQGQAHLTAIGATLSVEALLGLGRPQLRPGIAVPETAPDGGRMLALLATEGVQLSFSDI